MKKINKNSVKELQKQYEGYTASNLLWTTYLMGLEQFEIKSETCSKFSGEINANMRLGSRVERFVFCDLERMPNTKILYRNIQIKEAKQTIGEMDCLFIHNNQPIHLEIMFKLYLYDPSVGNEEVDRWIGGNRKDSLIKKLRKIKEKQFPLLYHPNTKPLLEAYNLSPKDFKQMVHCRAQLFIPYRKQATYSVLNPNCEVGFYIKLKDLKFLTDFKFYVPKRINWLIAPYTNVEWQNFNDFKESINELISYKSYPLCWLKYPNRQLQKFFVVWW